jgi:predicted adenylyl cyclase CyaB
VPSEATTPTGLRRNIELKARCRDLAAARAAAERFGARFEATLHQIDTYFRVPHGRLKLREIDNQRAELIGYERSNDTADRASHYRIVLVSDPAALRTTLAAALGVRGDVRKRRDLLRWHNVRIHLDQVDGLGNFLEFEAVVSETDGETISRERLKQLAAALNVSESDRIAVSYSDLLGL